MRLSAHSSRPEEHRIFFSAFLTRRWSILAYSNLDKQRSSGNAGGERRTVVAPLFFLSEMGWRPFQPQEWSHTDAIVQSHVLLVSYQHGQR